MSATLYPSGQSGGVRVKEGQFSSACRSRGNVMPPRPHLGAIRGALSGPPHGRWRQHPTTRLPGEGEGRNGGTGGGGPSSRPR